MGTVRRKGDWTMEKKCDGVYEVWCNNQLRYKIVTKQYTPDGLWDERNDLTTEVVTVGTFKQAVRKFKSLAHRHMRNQNHRQSQRQQVAEAVSPRPQSQPSRRSRTPSRRQSTRRSSQRGQTTSQANELGELFDATLPYLLMPSTFLGVAAGMFGLCAYAMATGVMEVDPISLSLFGSAVLAMLVWTRNACRERGLWGAFKWLFTPLQNQPKHTRVTTPVQSARTRVSRTAKGVHSRLKKQINSRTKSSR